MRVAAVAPEIATQAHVGGLCAGWIAPHSPERAARLGLRSSGAGGQSLVFCLGMRLFLWVECLFSLVKPWLRKFRGLIRSLTLAGASSDITIDCLVMGVFRSSV